MPPMDEAALLDRLQAGDESAFRELVQQYHTTMVRVARYYVASAATAEDVAQETWIAVIKGIERFERRSSLATWLMHICANRARSIAQREHRVIPVDVSAPAVESSRFTEKGLWNDPPVAFTEAVEFRVDSSWIVTQVRDAIATLGEPQCSVVTLRDVEGLSTEEVAQILDITEGNVRVILHRGRAKVRSIVEQAVKGASS